MRLTSLAISLTLIFTTGCGSSSSDVTEASNTSNMDSPITVDGSPITGDETPGGSTAMYSGSTFVSLDPLAPGVVSFGADTVEWSHNGITKLGTYSNNGETDLVAMFSDEEVNFSADGGNIIWDSSNYERTARLQFDSQEDMTDYFDGSTYSSVEKLDGGEVEVFTIDVNGVSSSTFQDAEAYNWSMSFYGDEVSWMSTTTISVGTASYIDGSTFTYNYDNSSVLIAVLENDQLVINGDIYEKQATTQFDSQESLIEFLDGAAYESVLELGMGDVNGVTALGNWTINFSNDTFEWMYEDVAEAGTVTYLDSSTFTAILSDREYTIEVDGNDLIWDTKRYTNVK